MKNRILLFVFSFFTLMGFAPILTGYLGLGGKRGPVFYPESIHDLLFSIGCKIGGRPIPKSSFVQPMMQRAYFFGINEHPLNRSEREMKIEDMKKRGVNAHYIQGQIDFHEQLNNETEPNK